MTAPKPKPVRAWAIYSRGGVIPRHALTTSCLCVSPKRGKFLVGPGERVIRVTIVPDGTPSQAAEVRKLRRLLRIALCAAENYIAAMEPHEGECDEPEDQAVIWHARKHVAEVKAALRGRRGAK